MGRLLHTETSMERDYQMPGGLSDQSTEALQDHSVGPARSASWCFLGRRVGTEGAEECGIFFNRLILTRVFCMSGVCVLINLSGIVRMV